MSPSFRERLHPGPFGIAIAALFGALLGIILMPVIHEIALFVAATLALAFPLVLWFTSPVVSLDSEVLRAGRAHIELTYLGDARELRAGEFKNVLGPGIRPLDFRLVRGWIPTGVTIENIDGADAANAWIISLRGVREFLATYEAARSRARDTDM